MICLLKYILIDEKLLSWISRRPKVERNIHGIKVMIVFVQIHCWQRNIIANSKVHGANMGPTWVLSAPDGPHVGPMNLAVRGGSRPHCLLTITCLIAVNRHIGCRIRYVVTTGGWVSIEVAGGLVTIRCQGICNHRVNPVRSMSYQYIDAASACNTENQELLWWQFDNTCGTGNCRCVNQWCRQWR